MREQLEARRAVLQQEFEAGQRVLADLTQRRNNLEQTLLRISGAIQVLDELLTPEAAPQEAQGADNAG